MLTSFTRGAKSKLAGLCLAGSMLVGSGCALDLLPRVAQPGFYRDYKDGEVRNEERVSQKRNNSYPVLFTGDKDYNNIGKQIFRPGEEIRIRGNFYGLLPNGTSIANENIHLSSGQKEFLVKPFKVDNYMINGIFDARHLAENIGTGEYENIWYAQINGKWEEIGRVRYAVFGDDKSVRR